MISVHRSFILSNRYTCFHQVRTISNHKKRALFNSVCDGSNIQFHKVNGNDHGVLVIVSGWLGGKPRYMQKYVDFWKSKNFDVLCYQTRWRDLLLPTLTFEPKALKLVETINQTDAVYPKILFHTFSSGCYLYASVIEAILQSSQYHHCNQYIKGAIFDSLADWPHTLLDRNSLNMFLGHRARIVPVERIRSDAMPALRKSSLSFPTYLCYPPFNFDTFQDKNRTIYANPFNIPGLFLFSDDDLLSHPFQVRRIIDHWRQRKIHVSKKHWKNSKHVQHYRLHQGEYERQVELFIARTLQINYK